MHAALGLGGGGAVLEAQLAGVEIGADTQWTDGTDIMFPSQIAIRQAKPSWPVYPLHSLLDYVIVGCVHTEASLPATPGAPRCRGYSGRGRIPLGSRVTATDHA